MPDNDKKITTGRVQSDSDRFWSDTGTYIFQEYVAPRAKDATRDLINGALDLMTGAISDVVDHIIYKTDYKESTPRQSSRHSRSNGTTSYNTYYKSSKSSTPARTNRAIEHGQKQEEYSRSVSDAQYITVETRLEAEKVCNALIEQIDIYGQASVADLYQLVGLNPSWNDFKWGFFDSNDVSYRREKGAFHIIVPEPKPITSDVK